jgi:hypothetical protein
MKLPNSTKKQKTRATLSTSKIISLSKRKMRFQDVKLGKIRDCISTNWGIKLKEN